MGRIGDCAVVVIAFRDCCMKHTRDEVWVYSEHSLRTKEAPGAAGAAVVVCPVLGTHLDTVSRRDRGREKC